VEVEEYSDLPLVRSLAKCHIRTGSGMGSGSGSGSGSRAGGGGGAKTPFRKVRQKGICENAEHESTANTKGGVGNGNRKKENKEQAREKGHKIASWHASADEGGGESSGTAVVANTNANMHWNICHFLGAVPYLKVKRINKLH